MMTIIVYVYCPLTLVTLHRFLPRAGGLYHYGAHHCDFRLWALKRTVSMRRVFLAPLSPPPLFSHKCNDYFFFIHVPVVHMLLSTFAMLN